MTGLSTQSHLQPNPEQLMVHPPPWVGRWAVVQPAPGEMGEAPACSRLPRALFKFHNVDNFANRHLMQAQSSQSGSWKGRLGRGRGRLHFAWYAVAAFAASQQTAEQLQVQLHPLITAIGN